MKISVALFNVILLRKYTSAKSAPRCKNDAHRYYAYILSFALCDLIKYTHIMLIAVTYIYASHTFILYTHICFIHVCFTHMWFTHICFTHVCFTLINFLHCRCTHTLADTHIFADAH